MLVGKEVLILQYPKKFGISIYFYVLQWECKIITCTDLDTVT